jgi:hypothetical protein
MFLQLLGLEGFFPHRVLCVHRLSFLRWIAALFLFNAGACGHRPILAPVSPGLFAFVGFAMSDFPL